jgi:hypothetical protein
MFFTAAYSTAGDNRHFTKNPGVGSASPADTDIYRHIPAI